MRSYFFYILFLHLPPGFYFLIEETGLLLKQFSLEKKACILSKCQKRVSSLSVVCRF